MSSQKTLDTTTMDQTPQSSPERIASQRDLSAMQPDQALLHTSFGNPTKLTAKDSDTVRSESNKRLAKIAISRQSGIAPRYNRRVPRACESCRQRKTKCSGEAPVCRQCRELSATCVYPVGWKEKVNKQVGQLFEKVQDYERMLRYLSGVVDMRTAEQIKNVLDKYSVDVDSASSNSHSTPRVETPQAADEPAFVASVDSSEAIDGDEEGQSYGDPWGPRYLEDLVFAQSAPFADHDYPNFGEVSSDQMASAANGSVDDMCYPNDPTIFSFYPYTNHSPWG